MSGDSAELRNAAKIIAPYGSWVFGLYTSGTAVSLDLSTIGPGAPQPDQEGGASINLSDITAPVPGNNVNLQGCLGRYVRFTAVSATCWVLFGPTQASVTSGNAPVIPTGGSNLSGVGVPEPIFAGQQPDMYITASTRWIGLIGAAATFLMIRPASVGGSG